MQSAQRNVTKRERKRGGETKRAPGERETARLMASLCCLHYGFGLSAFIQLLTPFRNGAHFSPTACSQFIMRVCVARGICLNKIDNFYFAVKSRQAKCCNTDAHTHTHSQS